MPDTALGTAPQPSAAIPHQSRPLHRGTPPAAAVPECLWIGISRTRGGALVRLEGELDVAGAPALTSVLVRCMRQPGSITVDASGLVFIDAAGGGPPAGGPPPSPPPGGGGRPAGGGRPRR
ncbi:STAS domain-containing protein, partial [Streptomyces sp. NPDC058964]|uniref:STAS domain-containing protein n=1 Tax=Streptomyces sp. NPDC058964 TaxID=3346681 RepID=UPI0036847AD1